MILLLQFATDSVTPRVGVWIEIAVRDVCLKSSPVTPRVGVWIEIKAKGGKPKDKNVTPRVGVWIEIGHDKQRQYRMLSLPVRECGLKLCK